jgi:hypothetical protein
VLGEANVVGRDGLPLHVDARPSLRVDEQRSALSVALDPSWLDAVPDERFPW